MADMEKVRKGLKCCSEYHHIWTCPQCPYYKEEDEEDYAGCTGNMAEDAKDLLKSQQQQIEAYRKHLEPVYPVMRTYATGIQYSCGYCGTALWIQKDTATLTRNLKEYLFCHHCGRPVKYCDETGGATYDGT